MNEKAGTKRTVGGGFLETAGRTDALDALVGKFKDVTASGSKQAIIKETEDAVAALDEKQRP